MPRSFSDNSVYRTLANEHRRALVRALNPSESVEMSELTERFGGYDTTWYHNHVPALREAGIIEFNSGSIVPGPKFEMAHALVTATDGASDACCD